MNTKGYIMQGFVPAVSTICLLMATAACHGGPIITEYGTIEAQFAEATYVVTGKVLEIRSLRNSLDGHHDSFDEFALVRVQALASHKGNPANWGDGLGRRTFVLACQTKDIAANHLSPHFEVGKEYVFFLRHPPDSDLLQLVTDTVPSHTPTPELLETIRRLTTAEMRKAASPAPRS